MNKYQSHSVIICRAESVATYPGRPPDSMWLASVTSCDHTSNCHFLRPITPQSTLPEWTPTLMLMSISVASRTCLEEISVKLKAQYEHNMHLSNKATITKQHWCPFCVYVKRCCLTDKIIHVNSLVHYFFKINIL